MEDIDFPTEVYDFPEEDLTHDIQIPRRCREEIERLTPIILSAKESYGKKFPESNKTLPPFVFKIAPDEKRGHDEVKRVVSSKLRPRFPGLEFHYVVHYADTDEWRSVPEGGFASFEYRIHFGKGKIQSRDASP